MRSPRQRGLDGVRLAVSDDHQGLKAAIARVLACPWQRCTVHFVRSMHQHCRPAQRALVSAALREVFNADSHEQARERVSELLERLGAIVPNVCALLEQADEDLLASYAFPAAHWSKLRSTNPLERVNREIGRRSQRRRLRRAHIGTAPVPASSGRVRRHRLNRGGNRQLKRALYTIAMIQARWDPAARAYLERKQEEGKSAAEARRCLKRHLSNVVYRALLADQHAPALT